MNNDFEMLVYRQTFRLMLTTGSERVIQNDSQSHAIVLIEELIRFARKDVYIYCKCLDGAVWGMDGVVRALRDALDRGVSFYVLTQKDKDENSEAVKLFKERNVTINKANENSIKENFMVVDRKAFRFEQDPNVRKGIACANSPVNAQLLIEKFQKINNL